MPQPTGAPPLAALKQWLAISTPAEDALLGRLLIVAHETCQHFVGPAAAAADWAELPPGLTEGIIRFAAHLYRDRDGGPGSLGTREPPAAVAALWRPWREPRL